MNCDCINKINERLKEKNLQLTGYAFVAPDFRTKFTITTQWIDRTKAPKGSKLNPPKMFVSFCPFCGDHAEHGESDLSAKSETSASIPSVPSC
jgi:hypothetical protein